MGCFTNEDDVAIGIEDSLIRRIRRKDSAPSAYCQQTGDPPRPQFQYFGNFRARQFLATIRNFTLKILLPEQLGWTAFGSRTDSNPAGTAPVNEFETSGQGI